MTLRAAVVDQFREPQGAAGRLAGWIMAHRPSNRRRNAWTVDLLEPTEGARVLEVGCGPGVALARCVARVGRGEVVGLDHSATVLAMAANRNRAALDAGRLRLVHGGLDAVAGEPTFDAAYAVNVFPFLPEPQAALRAIHDLLVPGGRCALTLQPRGAGCGGDAAAWGRRMVGDLAAAGFSGIASATLALRPRPAVCVLGRRPE